MATLGRILLAEDDARDAELTLSVLAEHNLANEVVLVKDGAKALDYLLRRGEFKDRTSGNPAVILLDIKMPKVDGLEVLRIVRADEQLSSIPVVMLTSSREERDLVESYALGANGYVVKPVDFQEFFVAIERLGTFWAVLNEPPRESISRRA